MSFGFGVGDFIAVGELCWKLYSQVYEVSRGAPEVIQNLKAELGDMHLTINKLVEDTKDPDSILVQSGSDRLNLACSVLEKTQETLKKLDDLSGKYELLQKPSSHLGKRHFWKRNYDKVKFAAESRTINDLRAKLVFHNGQISLLLQMIQNSSLERIENMQKRTENALRDIKAAISGTASTTPLLSGVNGVNQQRMTRKLLENAEIHGRPWTSLGIRDWLQTGKWWLLKAQSQLYSATPQTPEYLQAHVDLIKASWILTDIVALHPQRNFFGSGTQEMDILDIVQAVKSQHDDLVRNSFPSPALHELEGSSWEIWIPTPSTALLPNLGNDGPYSRKWGTSGGFTLFQKFAILHTSSGMHECIVFLEVKSEEETFTLIAQSFGGQDLCRHSIPDQFDDSKTRDFWGDLEEDNVMYLHDEIKLEFSTRGDFLTAFLLTCGAKLCAAYAAEYQSDQTLIYTMALFNIVSTRSSRFYEELRIIEPRTEELINDKSNSNSKEHSKLLWDWMNIPTVQEHLAGYWEPTQFSKEGNKDRYGKVIIQLSESLEQCNMIFSNFPKLIDDDIRNIIDAAGRGGYSTHVCTTTKSRRKQDGAITIKTDSLQKLLRYALTNKDITHGVLDGFSHMPARNAVSPVDLAQCSINSRNYDGIWYLLTQDGNIGINDTFLSEFWNLKLALHFMDIWDAPLKLFDEQPTTLNVFKETPYRTIFAVIAYGLDNAASRLSSRGLLDPNLPALVNGDGVDVLSGLDRSGTPHWPLCMAVNICSHHDIIRSLCQAGAHLGGDDEVLYNDLEIYKALLSRSDSQAEQIYGDTVALVRTAGNHPESRTNESMVPEAFISTVGQAIIPFGDVIRSQSYVYVYDDDESGDVRFVTEWKKRVLRILRKTQEQRNLRAWLRRNATITSALS